jgi:fanconi-associated nuclease 1
LIDARLADIRAGKAVEIIEQHDDWHREKKTWCVGVKWNMFEREDLVQIAEVSWGSAGSY